MGKNFKQVIGLCSTALLTALCACEDDFPARRRGRIIIIHRGGIIRSHGREFQ